MIPLLFCKRRTILQRLLMLKAFVGSKIVEHMVSGAIVTFVTNLVAPLKRLVCAVTPVQDLHGQDSPYPAGGGKNLLSPPGTAGHYVTAEGKIVMSGTASGNFDAYNSTMNPVTLTSGVTYTFSLQGTKRFRYKLFLHVNGNGYIENGQLDTNYAKQYTPSEETVIDGFLLRAASGSVVDVDAYYQLEVGSSASSYAPYSNICPISGWTGAKITQHGYGVNLFDTSKLTLGKWINSSGYIVDLAYAGYGAMIPVFADTYSFKSFGSGLKYCELAEYNESKTFIKLNALNNLTEGTVVLQSNTKYIVLGCGANSGTLTKATVDNMQIMLCAGGIPSTFKAYDSVHTITFPESAGTVYGGTLTVNKDGTGKLVVDRVMFVYDGSEDEGWYRSTGTYNYFATTLSTDSYKNYDEADAISNIFAQEVIKATTDDIGFCVVSHQTVRVRYKADNTLTPADLKAWLTENNLIVVIALRDENRVIYDLTELEVIETLKGVNNVWCDTGDVTVNYLNRE